MSPQLSRRRRIQAGFTLIELMVATSIGLVIMTALTSVVFTTYQANQIATSRVEASRSIGNFQATAYADFASSTLPAAPGTCGSSGLPCTQDPILLHSCTNSSSGSPKSRTVTYSWNAKTGMVDRTVNGVSVNPAATDVTAFAWYIEGAAPHQTVVTTLTVRVGAYTQAQTMRFYPRVTSQVPAYVSWPC